MTRILVSATVAIVLCLASTLVDAAPRGKGGGAKPPTRKPNEGERGGNNAEAEHRAPGGNQSPGGEWSQRTHSGKSSNLEGNEPQHAAGTGAAAADKKNKPSQGEDAAAGAAASKRRSPQASGAEDAAAGAAASNRKSPQATGAEDAAAGAAAAKRRSPQAAGAEDAAAGAAAANRKGPNTTGAQDAAAGAAIANRNSPQFSAAQGVAAGAAVANSNSPDIYSGVRSAINQPNLYGSAWYGNHSNAWMANGWNAGTAWQPASWAAVAGMYGYGNATPTNYDYGGNVNYQDGNVLVNGQSVGTAAEYSQQAFDLADAGAQADISGTEKWIPLGVFAMVRNENQHPQLIVQLAINEEGILRGNYTDEVTDHTLPIHGSVDKQTQRAAWTVGDNKSTVIEAGLNNLTQKEAPALIHKNGKTEHWILVRLDQPKQN